MLPHPRAVFSIRESLREKHPKHGWGALYNKLLRQQKNYSQVQTVWLIDSFFPLSNPANSLAYFFCNGSLPANLLLWIPLF